ncbi:Cell division cycle protein 45 [Balamuthia mandrillaris]
MKTPGTAATATGASSILGGGVEGRLKQLQAFLDETLQRLKENEASVSEQQLEALERSLRNSVSDVFSSTAAASSASSVPSSPKKQPKKKKKKQSSSPMGSPPLPPKKLAEANGSSAPSSPSSLRRSVLFAAASTTTTTSPSSSSSEPQQQQPNKTREEAEAEESEKRKKEKKAKKKKQKKMKLKLKKKKKKEEEEKKETTSETQETTNKEKSEKEVANKAGEQNAMPIPSDVPSPSILNDTPATSTSVSTLASVASVSISVSSVSSTPITSSVSVSSSASSSSACSSSSSSCASSVSSSASVSRSSSSSSFIKDNSYKETLEAILKGDQKRKLLLGEIESKPELPPSVAPPRIFKGLAGIKIKKKVKPIIMEVARHSLAFAFLRYKGGGKLYRQTSKEKEAMARSPSIPRVLFGVQQGWTFNLPLKKGKGQAKLLLAASTQKELNSWLSLAQYEPKENEPETQIWTGYLWFKRHKEWKRYYCIANYKRFEWFTPPYSVHKVPLSLIDIDPTKTQTLERNERSKYFASADAASFFISQVKNQFNTEFKLRITDEDDGEQQREDNVEEKIDEGRRRSRSSSSLKRKDSQSNGFKEEATKQTETEAEDEDDDYEEGDEEDDDEEEEEEEEEEEHLIFVTDSIMSSKGWENAIKKQKHLSKHLLRDSTNDQRDEETILSEGLTLEDKDESAETGGISNHGLQETEKTTQFRNVMRQFLEEAEACPTPAWYSTSPSGLNDGHKRVIALDGGGLKVMVQCVILERLAEVFPDLMQRCDLFAGISAGSMVASGLATGRSPSFVRQFFEFVGPRAFIPRGRLRSGMGLRECKFDPTNLKIIGAELLKGKRLGECPKGLLLVSFLLDNELEEETHERTWEAQVFHNIPQKESAVLQPQRRRVRNNRLITSSSSSSSSLLSNSSSSLNRPKDDAEVDNINSTGDENNVSFPRKFSRSQSIIRVRGLMAGEREKKTPRVMQSEPVMSSAAATIAKEAPSSSSSLLSPSSSVTKNRLSTPELPSPLPSSAAASVISASSARSSSEIRKRKNSFNYSSDREKKDKDKNKAKDKDKEKDIRKSEEGALSSSAPSLEKKKMRDTSSATLASSSPELNNGNNSDSSGSHSSTATNPRFNRPTKRHARNRSDVGLHYHTMKPTRRATAVPASTTTATTQEEGGTPSSSSMLVVEQKMQKKEEHEKGRSATLRPSRKQSVINNAGQKNAPAQNAAQPEEEQWEMYYSAGKEVFPRELLDVPVWDCVLASAAAPTFFPSYRKQVDGAVMTNDPALTAICMLMNQNAADPKQPHQLHVLSLGTGRASQFIDGDQHDWGIMKWGPWLATLMIEGGSLHEQQLNRCLLGKNYHRVEPRFSKPLPMDDASLLPALAEYGRTLDLTETIEWIEEHWYNEEERKALREKRKNQRVVQSMKEKEKEGKEKEKEKEDKEKEEKGKKDKKKKGVRKSWLKSEGKQKKRSPRASSPIKEKRTPLNRLERTGSMRGSSIGAWYGAGTPEPDEYSD